MKSKLKISLLSLCCVAFGASAMNASAAPTVRSLGGNGTYSGTVSASNNASAGAVTSAARAGTIRNTPSATTTSKSESGSTTARGASTSRLSIGKYLGSGTSIKNNTTIKKPNGSVNSNPGTSGSDFDPADLDDINKRLDGLDDQFGKLDDKFSDLSGNLDDKQNILNGTEYVYVENDEVGLELDKLADYLSGQLGGVGGGADAREIELQKTDTEIQWRHVGDSSWKTLVTLDEIRGEPGADGESGEIDPDVLRAQVDAAVALAVTNFVTRDEVNTIVAELTKNYVTQSQLDELKESMSGTLGRQVEIQATDTEIQWRYAGDETWKTLIALDKLRGPEGPQGPAGTIDETVLSTAVDKAIEDIKNSLLNLDGAPDDGKDYVPVVNNGTTTWVEVVE